jgi:myo-inositol catabolism protein IolS
MLYREFGKTGWKVSAIGQGLWNIGNQWGEMDDAAAERIVREAFDHGMNLFDVAESYGDPNGLSELRLGNSLGGIRDEVYVVSKIGNWGKRTGQGVPMTTADMVRLCGHACAGRLKTDRIDLMLCHDGKIHDASVYIEGFERLREEGYIREYGISPSNFETLKRFNEQCDGKCAAVEIDYSLINTAPEDDMLPYCREHGIGVLVRGPMAMGLLGGKYDAETVFTDQVRAKFNRAEPGRKGFERNLAKIEKIKAALGAESDLVETALRYVISHPVAPVAIPGATTPEQVVANALAGEATLDDETLGKLREIAREAGH